VTRLLVSLLAVGVLAGCGAVGTTTATWPPPSKPLSHGRFAYLANHACAAFAHDEQGFKTPTNFQMFDQEFSAAQLSFARMISDLQSLTPPSSDAGACGHLLATGTAAEIDLTDVLDAAEAHHVAQAKSAARRFGRLSKPFSRRAKKLRLTVCARI